MGIDYIWFNRLYPWIKCAFHHLTHRSKVAHICVSKLITIDSGNGLVPGRHQDIIWTSDGILLIEPLGTNFNLTLYGIHIFAFKKIHLKSSSGKWRPFCLGLFVLRWTTDVNHCCPLKFMSKRINECRTCAHKLQTTRIGILDIKL